MCFLPTRRRFHHCASWSVRARCSLFWRGTGDDVFGTEVPCDVQGEVRTHWRRREPGAAVKHWVKSNAIKMYDKSGRVLRIETVINDPKEFFVHRPRLKNDGSKVVGWFEMNKGVANMYRYAQVSQRANDRYLEGLAVVNDVGVGQRELDSRCAPGLFSRAETSRLAAAFTRRSGPVSSRAAW